MTGLDTILHSTRLSVTHHMPVCWTVAAHHSFTDGQLAHTQGSAMGRAYVAGLSADWTVTSASASTVTTKGKERMVLSNATVIFENILHITVTIIVFVCTDVDTYWRLTCSHVSTVQPFRKAVRRICLRIWLTNVRWQIPCWLTTWLKRSDTELSGLCVQYFVCFKCCCLIEFIA